MDLLSNLQLVPLFSQDMKTDYDEEIFCHNLNSLGASGIHTQDGAKYP